MKNNPYYLSLGQDSSLDFDRLPEFLNKFQTYLRRAIEALEKKRVTCQWERINDAKFQLSLPDGLKAFELTGEAIIELDDSKRHWYRVVKDIEDDSMPKNFSPDFDSSITVGKGAERLEFSVEDHLPPNENNPCWQIKLEASKLPSNIISWSGYRLEIQPVFPETGKIFRLTLDNDNELEVRQDSAHSHRYRVPKILKKDDMLSLDGFPLKYRILSSAKESDLSEPLQNLYFLSGSRPGSYIAFSRETPDIPRFKAQPLHDCDWMRDIGISDLYNGNKSLHADGWQIKREKNNFFIESNLEEKKRGKLQRMTYRSPENSACRIDLMLKPFGEKRIRLIDPDEAQNERPGFSKLDCFFSDNLEITSFDSKIANKPKFKDRLKYKAGGKDREERTLILKKNKHTPAFPEGDTLEVSVDTGQLRNQRKAFYKLLDEPMREHVPILDLFAHRETKNWPVFEQIPEPNWTVLTNGNIDGCPEQREFVQKALATPDYAILDGPPGTGKTTTILELIAQLALQNKRILLTASTHAAINNVLERVKNNPELSRIIFPLRIGDAERSEGIEEFQFDKLFDSLNETLKVSKQIMETLKVSKQIMVDSANLVCGTTMGILRLFREEDIVLERGIPPFDMMIIDECSKTTFQEFLVPALHAKRWILVGDVKQLSPFTDRDHITSNLEALIEWELQEACLYLFQLHTLTKETLVLPLSKKEMEYMDKEINERRTDKKLSEALNKTLLIQKRHSNNPHAKIKSDVKAEPEILYQYSCIFIDKGILSELYPILPADAIVSDKGWLHTVHGFRHHPWNERSPFQYRKKTFNSSLSIHQALIKKEQVWAEEICWRLERDYWMRGIQNNNRKKNTYSEQLEKLFPKSEKKEGQVYSIRNMAFPSILETLSGDGMVKGKNDEPQTINQGFRDDELQCRQTTLKFQHRMHPDISTFPREHIYQRKSLLDSGKVKLERNWKYTISGKTDRSLWLHVEGKVSNNANEEEAKVIIKELKQFCGWAESQKKADNTHHDVSVLTFYKGQEKCLREKLKKLPGNENHYSRFKFKNIHIRLATVDYFQGQEADFVFLSMVRNERDGFLDSPNRLNVSITRARYQLLIVGDRNYFLRKSSSTELKKLAETLPYIEHH